MNEFEWQLLEAKTPVENLRIGDADLRTGDRVRLHPRGGGDVMDLALADKLAMVESIEQDYEGKHHVCVVLDEDPGRDIGLMRQPGHRFFFDPEEIERLPADQRQSSPKLPRILIAGIGNIFLGDDAFGVEVAQRMSAMKLPENVRVVDFGIRGLDLAYALLDGYDTTILVDACPRGEEAGTLYVVEPDLESLHSAEGTAVIEAHSMNPVNVLRMARSMGGELKRVLLVGCEPATLGPEEGHMGLSEPIAAAVDNAVTLIEELIVKISIGEEIGGRP